MKSLFQKLSLAFAPALFGGMLLVGFMLPAHAMTNPLDDVCKNDPSSSVCSANAQAKHEPLFGANSIWTHIINAILIVIGMIAVLSIVIGGIRYVTSGGDAAAVKAARETIQYAIIGIVVAVLAGAMVNFVFSRF